ncbi:hypothetical protein D3C81_1144080 [compost metagenome]
MAIIIMPPPPKWLDADEAALEAAAPAEPEVATPAEDVPVSTPADAMLIAAPPFVILPEPPSALSSKYV